MRRSTFSLQSMLMTVAMLVVMLSLAQAEYTYHPYQDCPGGDMLRLEHKTVDELKAFCDSTSRCLGFNTEGYIKLLLGPLKQGYSRATSGFYAKKYKKLSIRPLQGYTFHQGIVSFGQDIIQLSGESVLDLKAFCDNHAACVGFSTDGWIKKGMNPSSNWVTWSMKPEDGTYVKQSPASALVGLSGYTFLRGQDYKSDAQSLVILLEGKTLAELKTFCDNMPDCTGFNTDGYIASSKNISMYRSSRFTASQEGFYKKNQKEASSGEGPYIFYPGKTYSDFSLIRLPEKSQDELRAYCDRMPNCVAFDSLGNLKSEVPEQGLWREWTTNLDKGLYIKRKPTKKYNTDL